jgi:ATP-dependent RNA helicase DeaD
MPSAVLAVDVPAVEVPAVEVPAFDETSGGRGAGGAERGRGRPPAGGRIFLSLGEADGADEARVREVVAGLAPGVELLAVELRRNHAFLEVAPEAVEGAVVALHGKPLGDKTLTAERARRRRR